MLESRKFRQLGGGGGGPLGKVRHNSRIESWLGVCSVCKEHYAWHYVPKRSVLLTGTGVWKISSVACGFSLIDIDYSDFPKSFISRINEVYVFRYSDV